MKTIENIADEAAKKRGYASIDKLLVSDKPFDAWQVIKEVSAEHAKQMCDLQIKKCNEIIYSKCFSKNGFDITAFLKNSILSTPNVAEKP